MVEPRPSRYQQVVNILDDAAGDSRADYGGPGAFWRDHGKLLQVEIHGLRMIAPADSDDAGCCGCGGRSARSGLISGLRGEAPFDGSRFPQMPWGGKPLADDDILFIARWIDDGCPLDDRETAHLTAEGNQAEINLAPIERANLEAKFVQGLDQGLDLFPGTPNEYASSRGEIQFRMNIDCMSEAQLERLRQALRHMYYLNKWPGDRRSYNNVALIHQNHCQHGWERFLPWHRVYMYEFEQALQDHYSDVTLPYWDWTMPQYRPSRPEKGWIIPKALQAYLTEKSLDYLQVAKPSVTKTDIRKLRREMVDPGLSYSSQKRFFKAVVQITGKEKYAQGRHRERFIDALLEANALWYPLRYPGEYQEDGKPSTIDRVIHYHYPTADDMAQIMSLKTFRDFGGGSLYNDSFGFLDQNPHNTMHIWTGGMNPDYQSGSGDGTEAADRNRTVKVVGRRFHTREDMYSQPEYGDMFSNLTASHDPVFWPVHSNVDRLWWQWQQANPHALPIDLDAVLTPWSYTIADTLDASRFGYDYVKCCYLVPVGLEAPVGRLVSKPIAIPQAAKSFKRAEVRLHRVPQLMRSGFVRVFLNNPGANASTPIGDPSYGGYLAVFGHGACYGGPGHCDLPARTTRAYDRRPRHHNTPRNHRIDVTACARALLDGGADSLSLTLVVVGADYREDQDLLRLEGVSLSFLD